MAEILNFKPIKSNNRNFLKEPSKEELAKASEAIVNDTWEWGYVVDVFFK